MKIDIVICTYNRPKKVLELITELTTFSHLFNSIILIDSSDEVNPLFKDLIGVKYYRSNHKNQPYQRYLGYMYAKAEILVFLDDDMEIANQNFLAIIGSSFKDKAVVGLAINFKDKTVDTSLALIPKSTLFGKFSLLKRGFGWFSGYPILTIGKFGLCGLRGKQPINGGETEWLSGGAFAARKSALFENFNFQLFDLFEQRLGMGEDAIIGYGLSKQGKLIYHPELLFYHNDQKDSTYSIDHFAFSRRIIYSRLYLSLEKTRLDNGSFIYAKLHYNWYVFWRIFGLCINCLINATSIRKKLLYGAIEGWKAGFNLQFDKVNRTKTYWEQEFLNAK